MDETNFEQLDSKNDGLRRLAASGCNLLMQKVLVRVEGEVSHLSYNVLNDMDPRA